MNAGFKQRRAGCRGISLLPANSGFLARYRRTFGMTILNELFSAACAAAFGLIFKDHSVSDIRPWGFTVFE